MAKIRIERNSEWNNKARAIGIYINGEIAGAINDGETKEYPIENGSHEVYAKIDWCSSQKVKLNISENETVILRLTGFKYGTWILPIIFGILLLYFLGIYMLNFDMKFLIWIMGIAFLYPMYFITFGKNRYLVLTNIDKKNVL